MGGQHHRELESEGIERERLAKKCFSVCGGCLMMEEGVVDVRGAERETDCRYQGEGGEGAKGSG